MKIEQITISHFGKLKDFTLSFDPGFNMIHGVNEQGKTTVMAFIRMMLYGSSTRTQDLSKNLRKKYTPWDGSKMGGSIDFTHNGQSYRLERMFGTSPAADMVKVWNKTQNTPEPVSEQKEIGKSFLGMGESAFEKSVFIGQIGTVIRSEKEKDYEIIQKLQNLVSSGDETKSYSEIDSRITTAIEKIKSRGGRIGALDKLIKEKSLLVEQKAEALITETQKQNMQVEYQVKEDAKNKLDEKLEKLTGKLELLLQAYDLANLERILEKNQSAENLSRNLDAINQNLVRGDFIVDPAFLEEAQKRLQMLSELQIRIDRNRDELKRKEENAAKMTEAEPLFISAEEFTRVHDLQVKLQTEKQEEAALQLTCQQNDFSLKDLFAKKEAWNNNETKLAEYKTNLDKIESDFHSVTEQPAGTSAAPRFPAGAFAAGILILLLSLIAGIVIHPLFYIGGIGSGLIILISLTGYQKKMKMYAVRTSSGYQFIRDEYQRLLLVRGQMERENAGNPELVSLQLKAAAEKQKLESLRSDLLTDNERMKTCLVQYQVATFEEFQERYYESEKYVSRKQELLKEIEELRGRNKETCQSFEMDFREFVEFYAKIKAVHTIEEAKLSLDELTPQFYEAVNLKTLIDRIRSDLRQDLNGRPVAVVREEAENKRKFLEKHRLLNDSVNDSVNESVNDSVNNSADNSIVVTKEEADRYKKEIEALRNERDLLNQKLAQMKSDMTHLFLGKQELSVLEDQIRENEENQNRYVQQYEALLMAKQQLDQAFLEMQENFGPLVNDKTASIFSRITGGKYKNLLVSRDLNISVREPDMNTTRDWQFFSGGTMDQVYFSLRLAIAEFLADQAGGLPLFIDDAFLQYDDFRTQQSLEFLENYTKEQGIQIMFFTCHQSLCQLCGENTNIIRLSD